MNRLLRAFLLPVMAALIAGCAGQDVYRAEPVSLHLAGSRPDDSARCARLFAGLDRAVEAWGVRDARATRLAGFPYLRSDRVLAALARQAGGGGVPDAWVQAAAAMDADSRRNEIAHLPDEAVAGLAAGSRASMEESARQCRLHLAGADLGEPAVRARLADAAQVAPEYLRWRRALGLYALTKIPFAKGVRDWQAATERVFNTPVSALPAAGNPVLYAPPVRRQAAGELAALFSGERRNALGLYAWGDADREALFDLYAPRILVDEASHDDRIGALEFDAEARLWVNSFRPVVYRRLSHTFMDGRWLPQFIYAFWFPGRPSESAFDLLAGRFDAVLWRVTVGTDGHPLAYDSIHACGCYHLFFPTAALRARAQPESMDETLFAPQSLPRTRAGESLVLHLEAGTHFIRRVTHESPAAASQTYEFAEDDDLRSLRLPASAPGGPQRRSAFGPDGILPGSERGERFLFWPMGIDNAGAMRQWGRHATAFVGERHFDDPDLFEKYFELLR